MCPRPLYLLAICSDSIYLTEYVVQSSLMQQDCHDDIIQWWTFETTLECLDVSISAD
jgi:hypothetical protein